MYPFPRESEEIAPDVLKSAISESAQKLRGVPIRAVCSMCSDYSDQWPLLFAIRRIQGLWRAGLREKVAELLGW